MSLYAGALWPVTPRPAWMVDGGPERQFPSRLASLLTLSMDSHSPASGYIVCKSDRRPVGWVRWDWIPA